MAQKRILLGHLGSFGDCLYATTVARQIKVDEPDCHLTWAIGSLYSSVLTSNPDIDEIWEFPIHSRHDLFNKSDEFEQLARHRVRRGDFDIAYFTQVFPNNVSRFDGTLRSSILRGYPKPITTSVIPRLRLTNDEVRNVAAFAATHGLLGRDHVVLFESTAHSGQSFMTPELALVIAQQVVDRIPDAIFVMSSPRQLTPLEDRRLIDGSELSFRENAELTKYCSLLVGCSSGISWLCTSEWAKPLPMIQLLRRSTATYASMVHDHEYFQLPTAHIVEMTDCSATTASECIATALTCGIHVARDRFHQTIKPGFRFYFFAMLDTLARGRCRDVAGSTSLALRRYGARPQLLLAVSLLLACLPFVPLLALAKRTMARWRTRRDGVTCPR